MQGNQQDAGIEVEAGHDLHGHCVYLQMWATAIILSSLAIRRNACRAAPSAPARPEPTGRRPPATMSRAWRSEEHTSELQSLMRTSYAVICLKKKKKSKNISDDTATRT